MTLGQYPPLPPQRAMRMVTTQPPAPWNPPSWSSDLAQTWLGVPAAGTGAWEFSECLWAAEALENSAFISQQIRTRFIGQRGKKSITPQALSPSPLGLEQARDDGILKMNVFFQFSTVCFFCMQRISHIPHEKWREIWKSYIQVSKQLNSDLSIMKTMASLNLSWNMKKTPEILHVPGRKAFAAIQRLSYLLL